MNKRSDTIRTLFLTTADAQLSADNKTSSRVASGPVRSMRESFSGIERENERLREQMAAGSMVLELDPALIDPSPLSDRFADSDGASFEALKSSISQRGQEVPVLVRQHPDLIGRYQTAYGHRRIRAARELGRQVRAIVKTMSDQDLVVAQGVENSARQDLSFIERAIFAMRLEDAGHDRSIIQEALSIDRAETSKLLSVARAVPADLVKSIGRAPRAGRGRWQSLARLIKDQAGLHRAEASVARKDFGQLDSDQRFVAVLAAASGSGLGEGDKRTFQVATRSGDPLARVEQSRGETRFTLDESAGPEFAAHLIERLPDLFEAFRRKKR